MIKQNIFYYIGFLFFYYGSIMASCFQLIFAMKWMLAAFSLSSVSTDL